MSTFFEESLLHEVPWSAFFARRRADVNTTTAAKRFCLRSLFEHTG